MTNRFREIEEIKLRLYSQCELRPSEVLLLKEYISTLEHRLDTADIYINDRKEHMIPEHYDDLQYIINEGVIGTSW